MFSSKTLYARIRKPLIDLSYKIPSEKQLAIFPLENKKRVTAPVTKEQKHPKRTLGQLIPPLPITFKDGQGFHNWKQRPVAVPLTNQQYPFKYYEIVLKKSLLGVRKDIVKIAKSLGLYQRHQVVWKLVSPRSAGRILKIKELVSVELVNEIPPKYEHPSGFKKIGSYLQ